MSSADLFEDGFPHGTKAGYERGCRGHGSCPGVLDFGRSCSQASMSYVGDYTYRKRVDAGLTAGRIAELERLDAEAAAPVRRVSGSGTNRVPGANERTYETPTVTVADSETPLGDLAEDVQPGNAADGSFDGTEGAEPEQVDGIPLEKHGTTAGYSLGCRLRDECPAKATTGVSCANAVAAKQREAKARKGAGGGAVSPQEAVEVPVEPVAVEPEIVSEALVERAPDPATWEAGTRVRAEAELADAKREIEELNQHLSNAEERRRREAASFEESLLNLRTQLYEVTVERDGFEKQVAEMRAHFDIQEQRLRAKAVVEATTAAPAHGASLQVRQMGDAFAFDISGGGEAVRLELAFESGQLQRAAVTTGN